MLYTLCMLYADIVVAAVFSCMGACNFFRSQWCSRFALFENRIVPSAKIGKSLYNQLLFIEGFISQPKQRLAVTNIISYKSKKDNY